MDSVLRLLFVCLAWTTMLQAAPSVTNYEINREIEKEEVMIPYLKLPHPYINDTIEEPEPNLTPIHNKFFTDIKSDEKPCKSPLDCNPGECCVVGMNRFSFPKCKKLGSVYQSCIGENEAYSTDLYFPNKQVLEVKDIYRMFCPCQQHLDCHLNECQIKSKRKNSKVTYIDP